MKLLQIDGVYVWHGGYMTRDIPKSAGMSWNKKKRRWETRNNDIALSLRKYADVALQAKLDSLNSELQRRMKLSAATTSDAVIPAPEGLNYYPYQKAGIVFAHENKNVLIGDAMGLGKTIQVIGLLNLDPTIQNVVIVCPASLKLNWKHELETWLTVKRNIYVVDATAKITEPADIIIVNYDIINRFEIDGDIDLLVGDECHKLKNEKTIRSEAFAAYRKHAKRLILLTGTPILNRPIELWNLLSLLDFDMAFWEFASRYCGASKENGWDRSGATNMAELQMKLRRSVMIRREKADVLKELPPKTRQIIYLDPAKYRSILDEESQFLFRAGLRDEMSVMEMREPSPKHISEMAILRHQTALAKVPDVVDFITTTLDCTEKIVVFAHHQDVIELIYTAFADISVKFTGGMSQTEKDDAIRAFQTNPEIRVFVGSIQAAGVGITLTAASTVMFAELDWVPGNLSQAEDRLHRIGQTGNVLVFHIVVDGSMDAMLAKRLITKQAIIDEAMRMDVMKLKQDERSQAMESLEQSILASGVT